MTTPSHDDHDPELAGVGATALGIALARAEESRRSDRLFDDPLASAFLDRAGSAATAFTGAAQASDAASSGWAFLSHTVAVRTRFFDDELAAAVAGGCGQVVLLAAGLDARALRTEWADRVRVFELDQPSVLTFKDRVLADVGVKPSGGRTAVPVDLREPWAEALQAAGHQAGEPTAWLLEGILPALTPDASDHLLAEVTRLAAPGSRLALDHQLGVEPLLDAIDPSLRSLWRGGPAEPPAAWLARHGWHAEVSSASDVARSYGREPSPPAPGAPTALLVSARRSPGPGRG